MEHFKKLMEKKRQEGKGSLEPIEASARGSVLHDMIGALDEDGMKKVKGLKKVTVASNDEQGLKSGLDKAKEMLQKHEGEMKDDSSEDEYDDQDEEGPNHMPTEKEATSFGAEKGESPETDEEEAAESPEEEKHEEGSPEHLAALKKELEDAKAHIAHLQKPKSFY